MRVCDATQLHFLLRVWFQDLGFLVSGAVYATNLFLVVLHALTMMPAERFFGGSLGISAPFRSIFKLSRCGI